MKRVLINVIIFISIVLTLEQCANPTAITGGEKDTIPPILIRSEPAPQSINVSTLAFEFEFDEPVNADKITQELLITPTTELKFTHTIKKNTVIVKFKESLNDSTTYTFNFRESIADATERNPVLNFKYAFSTGSYIDSLQIAGTVTSLLEEKSQQNFLVGLYAISDTLTPTEVKPYYFYNTDNNGNYQIENIRPGKYLLFSFDDKNNNLLFNPKDESFAVYPDTLFINSTSELDSVRLQSVQINADQLSKISARPSGNIFTLRYTKPINIQQLTIDNYQDRELAIPQMSPDKTEILFYKLPGVIFDEIDSVQAIATVSDTLNVTRTDTVYLQFLETNKRPKEISISTSNLKYNKDTLSFNITASKPLVAINEREIIVQIDTLLNYSPNYCTLQISEPYKGHYLLKFPFNSDSLYNTANQQLPDSLPLPNLSQLTVNLETAALLGVENDTLTKPLSLSLTEEKNEDTGIINITVTTDQPSFELRLINKSNKIIRNSKNVKTLTFKDLKPNSYRIEVYIDSNNNGRWEVANPWTNTKSEPIYLYPNTTELKSNWIVDIEDINF